MQDASPITIQRWALGQIANSAQDMVAIEEPIEFRVDGQSVAISMRTPGHDVELAIGFLVSEGIVKNPSDILEIARCANARESDNILNIFLSPNARPDLSRLSRHLFASSSCGICGKASIDAIEQLFPPVSVCFQVKGESLFQMALQMRSNQQLFENSGAVHAAALFHHSGQLLVLREDVGRHNALDKVIGWAFQQKLLPLHSHILFVSGRTSFEIMQKALSAGIGFIAAVSGPSSLAVAFAKSNNQTLLGFVRDKSFNIYSVPARVAGALNCSNS